MAYCIKTDGDNRLFDEVGRGLRRVGRPDLREERLRGEGGPQGKPPPKGATLGGGAATAAGGHRPCGPYSGGLQGPAEGEIPPEIAPIKNCGEENYA